MKIVILGNTEMLSNLIEGVKNSNHEIVAVLRYDKILYSKFRLFFKDLLKNSNSLTLIKKYKLNEIKCKSANSEQFKKEILRLNADLILVGSWGERLSQTVINLPKIATVNVHPSLLPKYRGPNPYIQTIKNHDTKSGLTFHLMEKEFDTGGILLQKEIEILPHYTSKELRSATTYQARLSCSQLLDDLENGITIPIKQNEKNASYYKNINPAEMMIDFNSENAEQICDKIRAFHPFLPCYISYKNKFFVPNPYKLKIIESNHQNIGEIISKNHKTGTLTYQCINGKAIEFSDLRLYALCKLSYSKAFTRFFIKHIINMNL
ncbi:MAG: formyltransferase family protein [Candidatus Gastranaerophilales bacterium]